MNLSVHQLLRLILERFTWFLNSMVTLAATALSASLLVVLLPGPCAPARAQTAAPSALSPTVPDQPKINLTLEQRHTIKELIKDIKVPSAPQNIETAVGATVPATVKLSPMPVVVAEKVPQVKSHLFFVENGTVVIVDPKENKIVDAIE
jgi:hypothetical protein